MSISKIKNLMKRKVALKLPPNAREWWLQYAVTLIPPYNYKSSHISTAYRYTTTIATTDALCEFSVDLNKIG